MSLKVENSLNSKLRAINDENLHELKRLNLMLFPGVYYSPNFYRDVLDSGFYSRLAYVKDRPVGLVCCCREKGGGGDGDEASRKSVLVIMAIGVLAQYRCFGIGTLMMRHVLNVSKNDDGLSAVTLHVKVDNSLAIEFYQRFGFTCREIRKNYYVRLNPPDAYVMELKLNDKSIAKQ